MDPLPSAFGLSHFSFPQALQRFPGSCCPADLAASTRNGKCFSDTSCGQSTEGEAAAPMLLHCPVATAFHSGWDRKIGLKIKLKSIWMDLDGFLPLALQLPCPTLAASVPSETETGSCYSKESLIHNILDYSSCYT